MSELKDTIFELTGPDGRVHRFRLGGVVTAAGQDYVVLLALDAVAGSAVLVTQLVQTDEGLSFATVEDEEIIGEVYARFMTMESE